ncbi:hypothetical protein ONA70_29045 [Micromonospora yasonensis]|uniref:hypothetical protein n=1 Tax=Micromonospora yasonensis TaxID=1128667 RepID=UPI0022323DAF|nr:hypothetical protein [Micromonospora yasonensis]MCW3844145.1 hypothetical protein [Micromonospora yasonensis]
MIIESLRPGVVFDDSQIALRRLARLEVSDTTPQQPKVWALVEFSSPLEPDALASLFAAALVGPGWYVNFDTDDQTFVVFPGRVFRYGHGDEQRRGEVMAYARREGVPESQLDW